MTPLVSIADDKETNRMFDAVSIRAVDVYTRRKVELTQGDRQKIQVAMSSFLTRARENTSIEEYLRIRKRIFDLLKELPVSYQSIDSGNDSANALLNIQAVVYQAERIKQSILEDSRKHVALLKEQTSTQGQSTPEEVSLAPEVFENEPLLGAAPDQYENDLKQAHALTTAETLNVYRENGDLLGFYPYGTPLVLTGICRTVDGIPFAEVEDDERSFVAMPYLNVTLQVSEEREEGKAAGKKDSQTKNNELAFATMRLDRSHEDYQYAKHKLDTYKPVLEAAKKVEAGPNPENGWKIMEAMGYTIHSLSEAQALVDKWQEEMIGKQRQLSDARREFVEKGGTF